MQESGDERQNVFRQLYVLRLLGVDAKPAKMW